MKRSYILVLLLTLFPFGQVLAQNADQILDKAASTIENAGGVKAIFVLLMSHNSNMHGSIEGEIALERDKFRLTTADAITFFDGKTQWSYLKDSDEVTVTEPTPEELQAINPYEILNLYKKGYEQKIGNVTTYSGKPVYEVILQAQSNKSDIVSLKLFIAKDSYQLLFIQGTMRDGTVNDIAISGYQAVQKFPADYFVFKKKDYPKAELIDLR